ncbi:MAG TPA: hypothetical protein VH702_09710 [Vicinamibacterales bacterium]|jgi:hypothetical protein
MALRRIATTLNLYTEAGRKKCFVPGLPEKIAYILIATLFVVPCALAQEASDPGPAELPDQPSAVWEVTRRTLLDPTTYTPAVLSYGSTRLDWNSSQVFFRHGFVEQNHRFTVSGFSYDIPISHAAGNRQILIDSLGILQMSVINNVTTNVLENILIKRYPHRRKLLRTLGWVERIGFASYWSYRLSADHFRKWRENEQMAQRLGYY